MRLTNTTTVTALALLTVACSEPPATVGLVAPPPPPAPSLRVELVGWGNASDPDGFEATLAGGTKQVAWNGAATFDGLTAGGATVTVSGVAQHCQADSTSRPVVLATGRADTVRFAVGCFGDLVYHEWIGHDQVRIHYLDTLGVDRPLTVLPGRQVLVEWAPDGERFLFSTNERGSLNPNDFSSYDIGILARSGGIPTWVAASSFGETWPRWSPDGSRVVYNRRYGAGAGLDSMAIRIVNADGSNDYQALAPAKFDLDPAWILGGSAIAFARFPADGVKRLPLDGGPLVALTTASSPSAQHVRATADGGWLSFMAFARGQAIWTIPAAGGPPTRVDPVRVTFNADWSPNGKRLALATVEAVTPSYVYGIRLYDRNGDNPSPDLAAFAQNNGGMSWSPDGKWIALSAAMPSGQQIYILRTDGSGRRQLTFGPGIAFVPVWRNRWRYVEPPPWVRFEPPPIPPSTVAPAGPAPFPPGRCAGFVGPQMGLVDCRRATR